VQLIGTAHGKTLENLLMNPTLSDLIGGIESVTLSDEEARRRGTQKTVLERRAPPTFDVLIEIVERDRLMIHADISMAVDTAVRGLPVQAELRYSGENGEVHIEKPSPLPLASFVPQAIRRGGGGGGNMAPGGPMEPIQIHGGTHRRVQTLRQMSAPPPVPVAVSSDEDLSENGNNYRENNTASFQKHNSVRIFPYGVARNRLTQAAKRLNVPVVVARDLSEADVLVTLRAYYRSRQQVIQDAEQHGMPIYVLRANTINQMESSLAELFNMSLDLAGTNADLYANQARAAIEAVLNGQRYVDLPPASAAMRRVQHELAREANLISQSFGKDPNRRVRIYRD
jgi:hypothetical protein